MPNEEAKKSNAGDKTSKELREDLFWKLCGLLDECRLFASAMAQGASVSTEDIEKKTVECFRLRELWNRKADDEFYAIFRTGK